MCLKCDERRNEDRKNPMSTVQPERDEQAMTANNQ
jgi:hypothetical protein